HLVPREVLGQIPVQRAARAARALRTDHVGAPVQHVGALRHVAAHAPEWIPGPGVVPVAGTVDADGSVIQRVAPGPHDGLSPAPLAAHGKVAYTRKGAPAW